MEPQYTIKASQSRMASAALRYYVMLMRSQPHYDPVEAEKIRKIALEIDQWRASNKA
jgi:hypothetical protein